MSDDTITIGKDFVEHRYEGRWLRVEAWTQNSIRVRCTLEHEMKPFDWAINPRAKDLSPRVEETGGEIILTNGRLAVALARKALSKSCLPPEEASGYRIVRHQVTFYGVCPDCQTG